MTPTALLLAAVAVSDLATFHIGNSLTWDSQPTLMSHTVGHHILCGEGLDAIGASPESTCLTPHFGYYQDALANHEWTHVFVQPYYGSTLAIDAAFVRDIHQREPDAQIVLYEAWPSRISYDAQWNAPITSASTQLSAAYFDLLSAELSDVPHDRVQVGKALYNLNQTMNVGDLYRDDIHLGLDTGRYVAHAAVHHYLTGTFPQSSTLSAGLSELQISAIHSEIAAIPEPSAFWMLALMLVSIPFLKPRTKRLPC